MTGGKPGPLRQRRFQERAVRAIGGPRLELFCEDFHHHLRETRAVGVRAAGADCGL